MRFLYYAEFSRISDCEGWIATTLERQGHYVLRMPRQVVFSPVRLSYALAQVEADVLLLSKTPEITAEQLRYVKDATGVKVVFWTFDWMQHPETWAWYAPLARIADVCFQTDGYGGTGYEGINRVELHQGAFPDLHHPVVPTVEEREKFTADVAFCGSVYSPRRRELIKELSRYDFKLWGNATEELWGRPFAAMVACSRIVVCDNWTNDVPGYWSDRVYLTMACGGFVAAAFVPGMERVFDSGEDLIWWHDFRNMHAAIEHFLAAEGHRQDIARHGSEFVQRFHIYERRAEKMIKVLEGIL